MKRFAFLLPLLMLLPSNALGYPNGTPFYVTDTSPFCASCHSAVKAEYMPEFPAEAANKELPENKHYALVRMSAPPSPYLELTDEQKGKIINDAKLIDSNSTVSVSGPRRVKAGGEVKIIVKAKGGNGPVIGVMLVDRALRFQSRPIASEGWTIAGEPEVKGQDGKAQKTWLERRIKGLPRNLNFILIENQRFDPEKNIYPEGVVTYTVKAPQSPGSYSLAAAFLYGTENADKAGFFQRPSGRILFSEEIKVQVE
ncbi:MAG: hypothetical protein Q7T24_00265 [Deltaproteobacteria bacterium]|nr:hypothetical protein [Deltaproteobacteria bacterium]